MNMIWCFWLNFLYFLTKKLHRKLRYISVLVVTGCRIQLFHKTNNRNKDISRQMKRFCIKYISEFLEYPKYLFSEGKYQPKHQKYCNIRIQIIISKVNIGSENISLVKMFNYSLFSIVMSTWSGPLVHWKKIIDKSLFYSV